MSATAATDILVLNPVNTKSPDTVQVDDQESLSLVLVAQLKLVYLLVNSPFLAPLSTHLFIEARAAVLQLTKIIQPLLK